MDYTLEQLQSMMAENNGVLNVSYMNITSLPEGLVVKGSLLAIHTKITSLPNDLQVGESIIFHHTPLTKIPNDLVVNGNLDLSYTDITSLPEGLTVRGNLDISNTSITALPKKLVTEGKLFANHTKITSLPNDLQVGGSIHLINTPLTTLPNDFVVNGCLDVEESSLTNLPVNLMVKGYLNISYTPITSLPKNLVVGDRLYLENTNICSFLEGMKANFIIANDNRLTNPNDYVRWQDGDYKENEYIYADDILTFIKRTRQIGKYTFYQGLFPNDHVVTDGTYYAHCRSLKEGIRDLAFKQAENRGVDTYQHLHIDDVVSVEEAITMYRIITGACQAGVDDFVASLAKLKETYLIRELLSLTEGQYGHDAFKEFFSQTA